MSQRKTNYLTTLSSIPEVARRLGIAVNSARALIEAGDLTRVQIGVRCVRIRDAEVEAYIARQAGPPDNTEGGAE